MDDHEKVRRIYERERAPRSEREHPARTVKVAKSEGFRTGFPRGFMDFQDAFENKLGNRLQ